MQQRNLRREQQKCPLRSFNKCGLTPRIMWNVQHWHPRARSIVDFAETWLSAFFGQALLHLLKSFLPKALADNNKFAKNILLRQCSARACYCFAYSSLWPGPCFRSVSGSFTSAYPSGKTTTHVVFERISDNLWEAQPVIISRTWTICAKWEAFRSGSWWIIGWNFALSVKRFQTALMQGFSD